MPPLLVEPVDFGSDLCELPRDALVVPVIVRFHTLSELFRFEHDLLDHFHDLTVEDMGREPRIAAPFDETSIMRSLAFDPVAAVRSAVGNTNLSGMVDKLVVPAIRHVQAAALTA